MRFWCLVAAYVSLAGAVQHSPRLSADERKRLDRLEEHPTQLLSSITDYDVVHVATDHFNNYGAKHSSRRPHHVHPLKSDFTFTTNGHEYRVQITKNLNLFASTYGESSFVYDEAGVRYPDLEPAGRTLDSVPHCHYHGHLVDESGAAVSDSAVAVSSCDGGLNGFITHPEHGTFDIKPARRHMNSQALSRHIRAIEGESTRPHYDFLHLVYKQASLPSVNSFCGTEHGSSDLSSLEALTNSVAPLGLQVHAVRESSESSVSEEAAVNVESVGNGTSTGAEGSSRRLLSTIKTVEFMVVNDAQRYSYYGDDAQCADDSIGIVNAANLLYTRNNFQPPIQLVLVWQVFFRNRDPYEATTGPAVCTAACASGASCCSKQPNSTVIQRGRGEIPVATLLSVFQGWLLGAVASVPVTFDNAGLFSGFDFSGQVLGYATVGSMCQQASSSFIVQLTGPPYDNVVHAITAHEMAHNFGALHDIDDASDRGYNGCASTGYVMAASIGSPPSLFSTCSKSSINLLNAATDSNGNPKTECLDNPPTVRWGQQVCGNGYVEQGEQCDCGSSDCASVGDNCCNGATCQFVAGATCSSSGTDAANTCCRNCQIIPASEQKLCRAANGNCDVAEFCDGSSGMCGADLKTGPGNSCTDPIYGPGKCYSGSCVSRLGECRATGSNYGRVYDDCSPTESANRNGGSVCGTLWCQAGGSGGCVSFILSQVAQVGNGVDCGDGLVCSGPNCVDPSSINSAAHWQPGPWSDCSECGEIQTRNVTCVNTQTGLEAPELLCSPGIFVVQENSNPVETAYNSRPFLRQQCAYIGPGGSGAACVYANTAATLLANQTVLFAILGALAFFCVVFFACYQAVTYKGIPQRSKLIKLHADYQDVADEQFENIQAMAASV